MKSEEPRKPATANRNPATVSSEFQTVPAPEDKASLPNDLLPLMPVRRLHNFVYCPRLFYYQWVENLFVENADTTAGSSVHRNVDRPSHWREELDLAERASIRSLHLQSESLGLAGVIDLVEDLGDGHEIIDYKKGSASRDDSGNIAPKENDAVQVAAYALLLREEAGIEAKRGSIWYAAERKRVPVALDARLFEKTLAFLEEARGTALSGKCPPPLQDDPRCLYCSAYPICLPNESAAWAGDHLPPKPDLQPPRPPNDDGEVLVVQNVRTRVGRSAGEITVSEKRKVLQRFPIEQLQSVYLYGAIQVSTQAMHAFLDNDVPVAYFSPAGRFLGMLGGLPQSGVDARMGQYRLHGEEASRLELARECIRSKIHNQRVLLMRNGESNNPVLKKMARLRDNTAQAESIESLRGIEGAAARFYFGEFSTMLKPEESGTDGTDELTPFDFERRNRRPPRDPVNTLLSLGYSMLAKELTGICHTVGLDPFLGFYHQPKYGRPALALDLMEEFRPLIADSVAISLLNRRELTRTDFNQTSRGCFLTDAGHRQFWPAWFRRLDTEVKHPVFGYRLSYRRMLEVQARQLWRFFRGEAESYCGFTTR